MAQKPAPTPAPAPAGPQPPRIFNATDTQVVPPATVRQDLPPFTARTLTAIRGTLEIVIDENGSVESAIVRESVSHSYDAMVVDSARKWRYTPATLNGAPVKFRKMVGISISAAR